MYAVIESGGKQYRVELGTEIQVDRLEAERSGLVSDLEAARAAVESAEAALEEREERRQDQVPDAGDDQRGGFQPRDLLRRAQGDLEDQQRDLPADDEADGHQHR